VNSISVGAFTPLAFNRENGSILLARAIEQREPIPRASQTLCRDFRQPGCSALGTAGR